MKANISAGVRYGALGSRPQAPGPRPQALGPRPQTPDPRPQTPDPRPQTPDSTPQTPDSRLHTPDFRHQAPSIRHQDQAPGTRYQASGFRLQASGTRKNMFQTSTMKRGVTSPTNNLRVFLGLCRFRAPRLILCRGTCRERETTGQGKNEFLRSEQKGTFFSFQVHIDTNKIQTTMQSSFSTSFTCQTNTKTKTM